MKSGCRFEARDGRVVAQRRYEAYGQGRWSSEEEQTDFGFNSQREESEFGLYDYQARYYSPLLGRFISADTIVPDFSNPQSLNRYAYVYNNPLKFTDPTGHTACGLAVVCHDLFTGGGGWAREKGGGGAAVVLVALTGIAGMTAYMADGLGGTVESYPLDPPPDPAEYRDVTLIAPPHIMQPHSAPMNLNPELDSAVHPDNLEIPSFFTTGPKGLEGHDFEDWLANHLGGQTRF